MVYPPPAQATNATDTTPAPGEHPGRHNKNGEAINDIVAVLGPSPAQGRTVTSRMRSLLHLLPIELDRWDSFDRASGQLKASLRTPSDHDWRVSLVNIPDSGLVITDKGLEVTAHNNTTGNAASYLWTVGSYLEEIAVEFMFTSGTTKGSTVAMGSSKVETAATANGNDVAVNSVHCNCSPNNFAIGIFNGSSLRNFHVRTFATPLVENRAYRFRVRRIARNTIRIYAPDGVVTEVTDSEIDAWWGGTAWIEHFQSPDAFTTDMRPVILGYAARDNVGHRDNDPWHVVGAAGEPAFNTPWRGFVGLQAPRFRKVGSQVFLDGALGHDGAANATVAFVLPVGYRPAATIIPVGFARLDIDSAGQVICRNVSAGSFHTLTSSFWID